MAKRIPLPGLLLLLGMAIAAPSHADGCELPGVEAVACPSLTGLGDTSIAVAISADGRTVVGTQFGLPARWVEGVLELFPPLPPDFESGRSTAVSADGSTIAGSLLPGYRIFVWNVETGSQVLATPEFSQAHALSDDGRIIGGGCGNHPCRWTDGVEEILSFLPVYSGTVGVVTAVSADGSIAAGNTFTGHAFRWDAAGLAVDLMPGMSGIDEGEAKGSSPDGSILVGHIDDMPARWDDLVPTWLETADGFQRGSAYDLSADGARLAGQVWNPFDPGVAALWDADGSVDFLKNHLDALEVDTSGWNLFQASAISNDGQTIVGYGSLDGVRQGYIAVLTPTVGLDIRPEAADNHVVVGTHHRVLLAVYGSAQLDLEALDASAFHFGPGAAPVVQELAASDLNADGFLDRRLIFGTAASGLALDDTSACLDIAADVPARVCSHVAVIPAACGLGFEAGLVLVPLMLAYARRRRAR